MMRSLFTAASGMKAQQLNMDTIANNLANVNTYGFKKTRLEFQDLLYEHLRLAGSVDSLGQQIPVGLEIGNGVKPGASHKIFTQGEIQQTGNPLDLMINGEGFFQVSMPDGTIQFTRDGSFKIDGTGRIVTTDGHPLEPQVVVPPQATGVVVRENGEVQITLPQNQPNQVIGQIQIAKFINDSGLTSEGQNFFSQTEATGEPTLVTPGLEGTGSISQGFLEASNVKTVEEMVNLIMTQRAYESNTKVITSSDQMLADANNLKSNGT
jgi:flagellar basal-body rod protein FlgG